MEVFVNGVTRISKVVLCGVMLTSCARSAGTSPLPVAAPDARPVSPFGTHVGYKSLYHFKGGADGAHPFAGVIEVNGDLYGTTYGDGLGGAGELGTVFKATPSGKENVLYPFTGSPGGEQPAGGLIDVSGTLYGTTYSGGANGYGCVFSIAPSGQEHVIYSFKSTNDGQNPGASLVFSKGMLYGTTINGGVGFGSVFEVTRAGKERVVYSFKGLPNDGASPYGPLLVVGDDLYGTTEYDGVNHFGTVFAVTASGKETFIYSFIGPPSDGELPRSGLIKYKGVLYGTTNGSTGAIFKIKKGKESLLYTFEGGTTDGSSPEAGLTLVHGKFYGTTKYGGANDDGTIFEATTKGTEKPLYSFKGSPNDGAYPQGLLVDVKNVMYGTTVTGGIDVGAAQPYPGGGTLFLYKL
jgi:uncharacterized repeat protein (TIGR03803 family)